MTQYTVSDLGMVIDSYSGSVKGYDFKRQDKNHEQLAAILKGAGIELNELESTTFVALVAYQKRWGSTWEDTPCTTLTKFQAYAGTSLKQAVFVWNKYEGGTAGGGQNTVRFAGITMKLTEFLQSYNSKVLKALMVDAPFAYKAANKKHQAGVKMQSDFNQALIAMYGNAAHITVERFMESFIANRNKGVAAAQDTQLAYLLWLNAEIGFIREHLKRRNQPISNKIAFQMNQVVCLGTQVPVNEWYDNDSLDVVVALGAIDQLATDLYQFVRDNQIVFIK